MKNHKNDIKVALYGYGTVGEAVSRFLIKQKKTLHEKSGSRILLSYIIDRDPTSIDIKQSGVIASDDHALPLRDPDVKIIIELIGGVTAAHSLCKKAIRAGKNIVTANKMLIAEHGAELCAAARERNVCIAFEASCGGGIPILRALYGGLISNRIDAVYAIINGTCNYILTQMEQEETGYDEALAEAQRLGFAEADPILDVGGGDSAHKLAIMTTLAYGYRVRYKDIDTIGINKIERADIAYGTFLNLRLKLIAMSIFYKNKIIAAVRPTFLSDHHPLRWVHGVYNAVSVYGNASGHTLFYGRGAGGNPTASAVISDIIGISSGEIPTAFSNYSHWPDTSPEIDITSWNTLSHRYYLRLVVRDQPGILGKITNILGLERLNISSIHQNIFVGHQSLAPSKSKVNVVITLNVAHEAHVMNAVRALQKIALKVYHIPILDERDDQA